MNYLVERIIPREELTNLKEVEEHYGAYLTELITDFYDLENGRVLVVNGFYNSLKDEIIITVAVVGLKTEKVFAVDEIIVEKFEGNLKLRCKEEVYNKYSIQIDKIIDKVLEKEIKLWEELNEIEENMIK